MLFRSVSNFHSAAGKARLTIEDQESHPVVQVDDLALAGVELLAKLGDTVEDHRLILKQAEQEVTNQSERKS